MKLTLDAHALAKNVQGTLRCWRHWGCMKIEERLDVEEEYRVLHVWNHTTSIGGPMKFKAGIRGLRMNLRVTLEMVVVCSRHGELYRLGIGWLER